MDQRIAQPRLTRRKLLAGIAGGAVVATGGALGAFALRRGDDGDQTEPDSTPAPSPRPTATPLPEATATATPEPGVVRRTTGAWESKSFAPGELIDWSAAIIFTSTATGESQAYRVAARDAPEFGEFYGTGLGGRLVTAQVFPQHTGYLLDRVTGWEWTWDGRYLRVVFIDGETVLFEQTNHTDQFREQSTGAFVLATLSADVQPVATTRLDSGEFYRLGQGGLALADGSFVVGHAARAGDRAVIVRLDFDSPESTVIFDPAEEGEFVPQGLNIQLDPGTGGFFAVVDYFHRTVAGHAQDYANAPPGYARLFRFDVEGRLRHNLLLPSPWSVGGNLVSMDPAGERIVYATSLRTAAFRPYGALEDHWPCAVVADAYTGEVMFRVRSAASHYGDWLPEPRWLADGSAFAIRIQGDPSGDGSQALFALADRDGGSITPLPVPPYRGDEWFRLPASLGPVASRTDPDLLNFGRIGTYRRSTGEWLSVDIRGDGPSHIDPWPGVDASEFVVSIPHGGHDGGGNGQMFPPRIEFPPFDDALRVRVARSGACLDLYDEPALSSAILQCLLDGSPLNVDAEPGIEREVVPDNWQWEVARPLPGYVVHHNSDDRMVFIRVRTGGGVVGWVDSRKLDWA